MTKHFFKFFKENSFAIKAFIVWRGLLFLPNILAPHFFKLQNNFLGLYPWANFDGEHYLNIAKFGYGNGEQAFFPLYPIFIKIFGGGFWPGFLISNASFLIALIFLYKLIKLDFKENIAKLSLVILLIFPGNFFFGSLYTESLFLMLSVLSFYTFKKENYFWTGIFGLLASTTRVVGIVLLPVFLFDLFLKKKLKIVNWILLIPAGLAGYVYYSYITWGDPIKFFHAASSFGEQRSDHLILLPQVFYRYIFKIIPNLSWDYFPVVFVTLLEISVALLFLLILFYCFKLLPVTYSLYSTLIYFIPTLSGSFSSLPRYILVAFPIYIIIAKYLLNLNTYVKAFIFITLLILSCIMQMLFVQGYFVS